MTRHLIFDRLKWFNLDLDANSQTIDGKQFYKAPKQIRTNSVTLVYQCIIGSYAMFTNYVYDVIGAGDDYYIVRGNGARGNADTNMDDIDQTDFVIEKSYCTPIWGGKSLPIRLYQAFKSLFTIREVA